MICKHGDKCDCYNENMYPCNHDDMVKCIYYKNGGYNDMVVGTDDEKYRAIIDHYGEPAQVLKAIEEMAELICDLLLGFDTYDKETIDDIDYMWSKIDTVRRFAQYHVNIEPCEFDKAVSKSVKLECADVENMLNQLRIIFGSWEDKRVEKLDRTMERIRK